MRNVLAERLRGRLAPITFVALLALTLTSCLVGRDRQPVVVVYGDSLTVQSEAAARTLYRAAGGTDALVFRARGGTAMCDWVEQARYDRVALRPRRIVLAFTGNTASCARESFHAKGVAGVVALYETSLRQMRAIFPAEPITILIPPAMQNLPTGWYPFNGNPALVAMYKRMGASLHMAINCDADDWLTPGHVFRRQRSAYPSGPIVDVRLSDGVHLTPAGEQWYGAALLEAKVPSQ